MNTYIALDVETANRHTYSLCSLGMVKFQDGKPIDQYYSLINPQEDFDYQNIQVHGIYPEDIWDAPTFLQIHDQINHFIGDNPIVAHNAPFDISAMKAAYERYRLEVPPFPYMCTVVLSRNQLKHLSNHRLNTVSSYYDINLTHHNALSDAYACGYILANLMERKKTIDPLTFIQSIGYPVFGVLGERGFNKQNQPRYTRGTQPNYQLTPEDIKNQNPNHPFYGAKIVISGQYKCANRNQLTTYLIKAGAIIQNSPNKSTHFVLAGIQNPRKVKNGVSCKLRKSIELIQDGHPIIILNEQELLSLIQEFPIS